MKNIFPFTFFCFSTFNLFSQPTLKSFSPDSGSVRSIVTIKGTGFSNVLSNNIVYFGAVRATVTGSTDSVLVVLVPPEATYQPISVTVNNLTVYSTLPFVVTFTGGNNSLLPTSFIPKKDFDIGIYPHSVLLADFNQDGKNDILVSRGSSNNISVLPNTSSGDSISFDSVINFPATGNNHEDAATADFDGDGKLDFVITNSLGSNSISVFRNTTTGSAISFFAKSDYVVDNGPYLVAIGDLDGDGKPDIVTANNGSNTISVFRNISTPGNILFTPRTDLTVGTNPYGLAIGDLNGDGKPDIVVTTQGSSSSLLVLKNNSTTGTILLGPATPYGSIAGPFVVSLGDLDGDGKLDLVANSAGSNSVIVMKNTSTISDISFLSGQESFFVGNYPVCVSIADLNGDGLPDIITSNRFSNNVSCLKNTSSGGTLTFDSRVDYPVNADPIYVAVGDLDGDSKPDIISANSSSTNISILRNIIGSNIAPVINSFSPTSGINGTNVTILGSNFNGVSKVKFGGVEASSFTVDSTTGITAIVGPGASGDLSVTSSFGTATSPGFTFNGPIITSFTPTFGVAGTTVSITGVNFDSTTKVTFGGTSASSFLVNSPTNITATVGVGSSGSVSVTTANGIATLSGFTYGPPVINSFTPLSGEIGSVVNIQGSNFDSTSSNNIVFFGAVKATVISSSTTQLNVIVPVGATYQPISVTTNKLTGYSSIPFITTFISDSPHITTNSFSIAANYGTGTYPSNISVSDLNDDGKPDIISVNAVGNNISILKNLSSPGTFAFSRIDFSTGTDPKGIAIGDLNGDGKPDIVISNFNSGNASTISIFRNTSVGGAISFAPRQDYVSGNGSLGITIADMNSDGKPDIIVTSGNSGFFSIFKNSTTSVDSITLASKQDYPLLSHPDDITTADLDKDGLPDIITSNFSGGNVSIFRNTSNGGNLSLSSRIDYSVGTNPGLLAVADLDNDQNLDIAVVNNSSGTITLLKNSCTPGVISFSNVLDLADSASNIFFADLNGDGIPELTSGKSLTGLISVFENIYTGAGNFSLDSNVNFTTGNYTTFVVADDLDGDGKPELAVANTEANTVSILKNMVTVPAPIIAPLPTTSGGKDSIITISGNNFTEITSVKFGGTVASRFILESPNKIKATLGGGASGNVTVTNSAGTATVAGFDFIPVITASGPITFCNGESVLLTSTAASNNQWYQNGALISGATATTFNATSSGSYRVKTTSNGITTVSQDSIQVLVAVVSTPTISLNSDNQLVSSAVTGNQWYLDGNLITGATNQAYHPTQNGTYTVKTTVNGCTSEFSAGYNFRITGVINLNNDKYIKLFPNPTNQKIFIMWNATDLTSLNIEITSLNGKLMLANKNVSSGSTIDISSLAQGVYMIRIYQAKLKINKTIKVIKLN